MSICSIYKITNKLNNKIYVGQTWVSIKERFRKHAHISSGCVKLQRAICKYGKDNFIVEQIVVCSSQEVADYLECFFIEKYGSIENGYNTLIGGKTNSRKGIKASEETRAKLSKSATGRKLSDETKNKLSKIAMGRVFSEEHRLELSEAKKGKKFSEAHKANLQGNHRGMTWKLVDGKRVWMEKS